jgi:magnesium chelatase family protein
MPGVFTNSEVKSRDLVEVCGLGEDDVERLFRMIEKLNLSARAYDKILRVARTIADLAGRERVNDDDLKEAAAFRRLDEEDDSYLI